MPIMNSDFTYDKFNGSRTRLPGLARLLLVYFNSQILEAEYLEITIPQHLNTLTLSIHTINRYKHYLKRDSIIVQFIAGIADPSSLTTDCVYSIVIEAGVRSAK